MLREPAGKVRLTNSCSVYIFLRVLLDVDVQFRKAKLVFYDIRRILAAFFQCLIQFHQSLFIANSCDRFTRFQQLVVYHTFLILHHLLNMNIAFWH